MNLLLLLSALLSALTGAVPGVRRADVPQTVASRSATAQAARVSVAPATIRPAMVIASLSTVAATIPLRAIRVVGTPIWIDRRRE